MHCVTCTCVTEKTPVILERDLEIDYYFASDNSVTEGPRGVSVRHKPTGIAVAEEVYRSQLQNKAACIEYLLELLVDNGWFDR